MKLLHPIRMILWVIGAAFAVMGFIVWETLKEIGGAFRDFWHALEEMYDFFHK